VTQLLVLLFVCTITSALGSEKDQLAVVSTETNNHHQFLIMPGIGQHGFDQFITDQKKEGPLVKEYDPFVDQYNGATYAKMVNLAQAQMDLGQKNCQAFFEKVALELLNLNKNHPDFGVTFLGGSQGSVAAFWFLLKFASNPEIMKKINGLIVEGFLATGNSGISQFFKKRVSSKFTAVPGAYYWLPYIAKTEYPAYDPQGSQTIHIGKDIGSNKNLQHIPIVFIHDVNDETVPIESSRAMYYALKSAGHPKVYYIETDNAKLYRPCHVNLLFPSTHPDQIEALKRIINPDYNRSDQSDQSDLRLYRPDLDENIIFKIAYDTLIKKERPFRSWWFNFLVKSPQWSSLLSLLYVFLYKTRITTNLLQLTQLCPPHRHSDQCQHALF
jgi:hypothetical protein